MNRPAHRSDGLLPLSGILVLFLMLAGCGGGGGGSTGSAPPSNISINPPQNVTATGADGSVTVAWSPAADAASYNLYWSNSPGVTKANGHPVANATSRFIHGGLPIDEDFYYVVCSVHATGVESAESAVASAWSAATHVPGPDVGQYFDHLASANYPDNSSHPLRGLTTPDNTLLYGGRNCLACHYASGPARTGDECLKCHFENQPNAPGNHRNGIIELAAINGNGLPTAAFPINTIQEYDNWCLQCHASTTISLGGVLPSAASRTVIDPAAFANGRHRAVVPPDGPIGCVHCHQPHGRSNAKLVRENPANRRTAGPTPARFGVYPNDNLGLGGYGTGQNVPYRSRPYWGDNTLPYVPEADDDQSFCNAACHAGTFSRRKDRIVKRDAATGNYVTTGAPSFKKIYIANGIEYTNDNTQTWMHGHVNNEIIATDNMVQYYAQLIGLLGPGYLQYPSTGSSYPTAYNPTLSALPFSYDFADGTRDFTNAYNGLGVRIAYRFTCSTCHTPHGTTLANSPGAVAYPDLRLQKMLPSALCNMCHR
jgi:hypothetical protein